MDETCPVSTEGWTRRVHFVREGGGGGDGVGDRRGREAGARAAERRLLPPWEGARAALGLQELGVRLAADLRGEGVAHEARRAHVRAREVLLPERRRAARAALAPWAVAPAAAPVGLVAVVRSATTAAALGGERQLLRGHQRVVEGPGVDGDVVGVVADVPPRQAHRAGRKIAARRRNVPRHAVEMLQRLVLPDEEGAVTRLSENGLRCGLALRRLLQALLQCS